MKSKVILTLTGLLFSFSLFAQNCGANLSLFSESAKVKNYDNAYTHYKKIIKDCPDEKLMTYQYGAKMFESFIENAETEEEKEKFVEKFIENQNMRLKYFPNKTKKAKVLSDIAKVKYKNKIGTLEERLEAFEAIVEEDADNFVDPVALYAYFRIANTLNDNGDRDIQFLFDKYDEVIGLIETQENKKATQVQPLIEKEQNQEELTSREKKIMKNSEIYLRNYTKIKGSVNSLLGSKADCENLIPMYTKDFEAKKEDIQWLKNAASRLFAKECTDDPIFFKIVEAQNDLKPSAKTALYLGRLAQKNGDMSKALDYYNQSAELEDNPADKARVYYNIAETYKNKGSFSSSTFFLQKSIISKTINGCCLLEDSRNVC